MLGKSRNRFVVLDVGSSALKALAVSDGKVVHRASSPRPADDAQLETAIRTLLADQQFRKTPVHVLLTESATRVYSLRYANPRDREQRRQAQQSALSDAMGRLISDYEIRMIDLREDAMREQLAVTVPRASVRAMAGLTRTASVAINGAQSAHLVGESEQPRMVVDIGSQHTTCAIVEDGSLRALRVLPGGGDAFTEALIGIAQAPDWKSAEALKVSGGIDDSEAGKILLHTSDQLMQQVAALIEEYRASGNDVKRVLMTGGASRLRGLVENFDRFLGARCAMLELPEDVSVDPETAAAYALALALMSSELPLDFTPAKGRGAHSATTTLTPGFVIDRRESESGRRRWMLRPLLGMLALIAAMAVAWIVLGSLTDNARGDASDADQKAQSLAGNVSLQAPASFLALNRQALSLADANHRQAQMMQGVTRLDSALRDAQLPSTAWSQDGYQQITVQGTGVLPPALGDSALARVVSPARFISVKQARTSYAITLGVPG